MKQLNTAMLESRLRQVRIPELQEIVDKLREFVATAADFELININPRKVAQKYHVAEMPTLKAFLYLTKAGVFDLSWAVHCPHCKGTASQVTALGQLVEAGHCDMC